MSELTIPDIEVRVFPAAAIPYRNRPGFVLLDTLGDIWSYGQGDSPGLSLQGQNPTITDDWISGGLQNAQWTTMENISAIRFLGDGTFREGASARSAEGSELFGFIIRGRLAYLDSKISGTTLNTSYTDLNWEPIQGTWQSVYPPGAPAFVKIRPTGSGPTHKAKTMGDIPASRSLYADLSLTLQGRGAAQSAVRFQWGGDGEYALSLLGRHDQKWSLQEKIGGVWREWCALDMEPVNCAGGKYKIWIRRIAGRLCININNNAFYFIFSTSNPNGGDPVPADAYWPAGPLQVNCFRCRATVGVGVIKYASPSDVPFTATFGRLGYKSVPIRNDEENNPPEVKFRGWARNGTDMMGAVNVSDSAVAYDVTMTASAEGIDTPFCSHVHVRFQPQFTAPVWNGTNLRAALNSMRVSLPSVPSSPNGEASIVLDRALLDNHVPGWESSIARYRPIEIRARRKYMDGTYLDGNWHYLFKGYITRIENATSGYNQHTVTLTCADPMIRLQQPAGFIDHRWAPHDILFAYSNNPVYYGYMGVREIIKMAVGEGEADRLNGNGNGLRYFPNSHYALLDANSDTGGFVNLQSVINGQPPTTGAFFFPAPYRSCAMDWINKYMELDKSVFFYGWPSGNTGNWPAPIYGRIPQIIAGMPTVEVGDAVSVASKNTLLTQLSSETRPDRDYNRVWASANFPDSQITDFMPGLRMAQAPILSGENRPELSWERTLDVSSDYGIVEGGVEALVFGTRMLLGTEVMKWPQFITRGNPALAWGVKCTFRLVTDTTNTAINLDDKTFRCEKVEHIFDLQSDGDWWTTSVQARPVSRGIF